MNTLKPLTVLAVALAMTGAAFGEQAASKKVARAPSETTGAASHSCLARDIATLSWSSDFSPYMTADCPADVRMQALRQLWRVMPPPAEPNPTEF
jgi:hypothetical protein